MKYILRACLGCPPLFGACTSNLLGRWDSVNHFPLFFLSPPLHPSGFTKAYIMLFLKECYYSHYYVYTAQAVVGVFSA